MIASVLRDFAHDAALAFEELEFDIAVFLKAIVGIVMSADEIARNVVALAEVDKLLDPLTLRCRWPTDLERRRNFFDRISGVSIKLEVFALTSAPKLFQIRLIPDFKKPLADFPFAVTIDPVRYQTLDKSRPLFVIFRRRHIRFVAENSSACRKPEAPGMKLNSTNGFIPIESRKSKI